MTVTISGMFGAGHTYLADSPVVIDVSVDAWPNANSPFTIIRVEVVGSNGNTVGSFRADTGGQTEISFDISSALRALWSSFDFASEVAAAEKAKASASAGSSFTAANNAANDYQNGVRKYRSYSLCVYAEWIDSGDGELDITQCADENGNTLIPGGQCTIGGMTEWERYVIMNDGTNKPEAEKRQKADASSWEHTGTRYGDASTKPHDNTPERVGSESITSWVDVSNSGTKAIFYPAATAGGSSDDVLGKSNGWTGHAPLVIRDTVPYQDFLFVNRRGALETCSGQTLEAMSVEVSTQQYARVERPSFSPSRSLMAIATGGRRSWQMSSGYQTREWADWWAQEFLRARQWWMLYEGRYVPVTVKPAKSSTDIYNRTKQQMPSVEFTVTLALEG